MRWMRSAPGTVSRGVRLRVVDAPEAPQREVLFVVGDLEDATVGLVAYCQMVAVSNCKICPDVSVGPDCAAWPEAHEHGSRQFDAQVACKCLSHENGFGELPGVRFEFARVYFPGGPDPQVWWRVGAVSLP